MKAILLLALAFAVVASIHGRKCIVENGLDVIERLWEFEYSEDFAVTQNKCCRKCNADSRCEHFIYRTGTLDKSQPQESQSACWLSDYTIQDKSTELFAAARYTYGLPNRSSSSSSSEEDN